MSINFDRSNIVITMAGRGSRFVKAGYTQPKYAIEAHGKTLFEWSMKSLENLLTENSNLVFVCLEENKSDDFVYQQCEELGYKNVSVYNLNEVTDGQATSALVSKELWNQDESLLIYNIDTYVNPRGLTLGHIKDDSQGWVPCFQAPGEHWSFVRLDQNGWADAVTEKQRISEYASIGLYWFADAQEYIQAYNRFYSKQENLVNGERYIAPLYKDFIDNGKKISICDIAPEDVHVLGTPDELEIFKNKKLSEL